MAVDLNSHTLLSIADAQAWLQSRGIRRSLKTLYDWIDRGQLAARPIGGRLYTSVEALVSMGTAEDAAPRQTVRKRQRRASRQEEADNARAIGELREFGCKV